MNLLPPIANFMDATPSYSPPFYPNTYSYSSSSPPHPCYSTVTTVPTMPPTHQQHSHLEFPSYPYPNYSNYCNYYQNTSLPPSTITHTTTHTLQQQAVQPPHSYSQSASPNAEIVQRSCNEILEFIEEFRNEMKESFQDLKESFQDIQESFQEVSESLKSRAKNIQNVFSTLRQDLQVPIEKEKVEEHTSEEPKKFVEGGDLQIIQEHKEKKEQESEPHRDFQSTFLCLELPPPPFLPTLLSQPPTPKSPESNTFTVAGKLTVTHPSPLKLPPPKPPDKVLPMFSSPSSNLQPPPEPSDLQSTPKSILPLPPTSRPPRKPPDRSLPFHVAFRSAVLRSLRNHHLRNIIFFWRFRHHSLCFPDTRVTVFDPGGKFVASIVVVCRRSQIGVIISSSHRQQPLFSFLVTNKIFYTVRLIFVLSHQWVENLICVKSIPPTVNCHASNCLSSTTSQARDVLMFLCISIFHAPAVVLLQDFKSTHSHVTPLMPTSHTIPPVWNPTRFANQFTTAAKLFVLERT